MRTQLRIAQPGAQTLGIRWAPRPADGFCVTAFAADGVIEAMEHEQGWFVGVQWHPEDTAPSDAVQQRLYDVFIEQAGGG